MLEADRPEHEQHAGTDIGWGRAAVPKRSKDLQKPAIAEKQEHDLPKMSLSKNGTEWEICS